MLRCFLKRQELPALLENEFSIGKDNLRSITGHSMRGQGARLLRIMSHRPRAMLRTVKGSGGHDKEGSINSTSLRGNRVSYHNIEG